MTICSRMKLQKVDGLKLFFYIAHCFGLVFALTIIVIAISKSGVEENTVGGFGTTITKPIRRMFYVSSSILLLTVTTGYLAQRWPDKSSLWILYCILLSIVSVVMLAASISSYTSANAGYLGRVDMKDDMELQDNKLNTTKDDTEWDKVQKKYKCCGMDGYKDWQDVRFGRTSLRVPASCCLPEARKKDPLCGLVLPEVPDVKERIYERGCLTPVMKDVKSMLTILYTFGFIVAASHTTLTFLTCYLVVSKKV